MKKIYLQPSVEMVLTQTTAMICASEGVTSDKGIGYGGVDSEGGKDPSSRRYHDVWADDF